MIAANFTGGEAEELRRAMGFKRSQARMKEIEAKLRAGMTQNGISPKAQEEIILSITSFALYGFPESHAASFALIAYASAYLKCHYLAAFTAALLNNQPMGFYSPATIVKDAQRHGLKLLPVDVTCSEWNCTLEAVPSTQYRVPSKTSAAERRQNAAHGASRGDAEIDDQAREGRKNFPRRLPRRRISPYAWACATSAACAKRPARRLVRERRAAPFTSIHDLTRRVPELRKDELTTLAEIGALNSSEFTRSTETRRTSNRPRIRPLANSINNQQSTINNFTRSSQLGTRYSQLHRRDALWQVERAVRTSGPLLEQQRRARLSFSARSHEPRRAPGRRLPRHRTHRRPASHGLSPRMAQCHGHPPRQRTARHSQRQASSHRRLRHRPPASRHRQRICVFKSGR